MQDVDELPEAARAYVQRLEQLSGVPVSMVSVGPDRNQDYFQIRGWTGENL